MKIYDISARWLKNKAGAIEGVVEYQIIDESPHAYYVTFQNNTESPFYITKEKVDQVTMVPIRGDLFEQRLHTMILANTQLEAKQQAKAVFQEFYDRTHSEEIERE